VIVGVGTDLIEVARIRRAWERSGERFLARHFTAEEIAYALSKRDPAPHLAARFAAKEAFQKAWPARHGWREVWVVKNGPRPAIGLASRLERRRRKEGWTVHLSLSHTHEHAQAVVVVEGTESAQGARSSAAS